MEEQRNVGREKDKTEKRQRSKEEDTISFLRLLRKLSLIGGTNQTRGFSLFVLRPPRIPTFFYLLDVLPEEKMNTAIPRAHFFSERCFCSGKSLKLPCEMIGLKFLAYRSEIKRMVLTGLRCSNTELYMSYYVSNYFKECKS